MESFLNHIKVECKALEEGRRSNPFVKAWLAEGQGAPDQLDQMLQAILSSSFLKWTYENWTKDSQTPASCKFDMYPFTKNIERNFIGPKSYLVVEFSRSPYAPETSGRYRGAATSRFNKDTGLLDEAIVIVDCVTHPHCSYLQVLKSIRVSLSHELIHAFEDFNRQCIGGRSLGLALADRKYPKITDVKNPLHWLAYVLDPAEQKTFIGQSVLEIQDKIRDLAKAGRLDQFENIRNVDQVLKLTEFWNTYDHLRNFIEFTQWDRLPKFHQDRIVAQYNEKIVGDSRSPFNRPITTYNQFLKKLRYRWSRFDETLKKKISQAVATELYKVSPQDPAFPKNSLKESIIYQAY